MDFLVIAPPVCTPAEPPAGAFMLTAALRGFGYDAALLDLSLELLWEAFDEGGQQAPGTAAALHYLLTTTGGYDPMRHRTATGALHKQLGRFSARYPGWKLSLMDLEPPGRLHAPRDLAALLDQDAGPFQPLCERVLAPTVERERPRQVLISLAYLSQLPAAIAIERFLRRRGVLAIVGGSLPTSLAATGHGIEALTEVLPRIELGDGGSLLGLKGEKLLSRFAFPRLLSQRPYLSSRPIVPLVLSTGCFWGKCLFCPDRGLPLHAVPEAALEALALTMPAAVATARPVVHLLDSAMPPPLLERFLPIAAAHRLAFYGFARPTARLAEHNRIERAADAGCLMLQLGVESGSRDLLARFDKGIDPQEAMRVVERTADAGIRTYLYLLFGLPGENDDDLCATLELVAALGDQVDFLNNSLFNLPRDCDLVRRAEEFGITVGEFQGDDAIRLYYPFACAGGSPRQTARRFLSDVFEAHPAIRPAVLRTPRWLRAAHLALMQVPGRRS